MSARLFSIRRVLNAPDQYPSGLAAPRAERRGGSLLVAGGGAGADCVCMIPVCGRLVGEVGKSWVNSLVGVKFTSVLEALLGCEGVVLVGLLLA